jgi:hypothetical protein
MTEGAISHHSSARQPMDRLNVGKCSFLSLLLDTIRCCGPMLSTVVQSINLFRRVLVDGKFPGLLGFIYHIHR